MAKDKKRKRGPASRSAEAPRKAQKSNSTATVKKPIEPTIPFNPEDRILLIGEGDFSFAKSIIEHHGCCDVTATCFDSQSALFEKYDPQAEQHIEYLTNEGQTILYDIDATKLDRSKPLTSNAQFDRILFNFPHIGGKSKDVNRQVRANQELLVGFFAAAKPLLAPEGLIVITLFEGEPYTLWNIRDLARHSELQVQRSFKFLADAYPGYSHARTLGNIEGGGGWKGEDRESRSYCFQKKSGVKPVTKQQQQQAKADSGLTGSKNRKMDVNSDSEDDG